MLNTPEEYLESLDGDGKDWLNEFLQYMSQNHKEILPVMFRQRPMYKVGKSYVFFTVAKDHFSIHTLNFELIEELKKSLPKAKYGKGCIKVKFSDVDAKPILKKFCDDIVQINLSPNAPEVDVVPELPYEQNLANAFKGSKAKWQPLYEEFRDFARKAIPEFIEYFPAVNILWKHKTTFAQISAVSTAMRVEFYSDALHMERNPIKTMKTSKNRIMHLIEVVDDSDFNSVLKWIEESYQLTKK